jgi:hypothetical protein
MLVNLSANTKHGGNNFVYPFLRGIYKPISNLVHIQSLDIVVLGVCACLITQATSRSGQHGFPEGIDDHTLLPYHIE